MKQYFAVTGQGFFPADMLRYDGAEPLNEVEAGKMNERLHDEAEDYHEAWKRTRELITICLMSDYKHAPTVARWASFGWTVTEVRFTSNAAGGYYGAGPGEALLS